MGDLMSEATSRAKPIPTADVPSPGAPRTRGCSRRLAWWILAGLFLCLALPAPLVAFPSFDGERAMADIRTQVEFGPRVSGRPGHTKCLEWMDGRLRSLGWTPERQEYRLWVPALEDSLDFTNLLVRISPGKEPRILFGAHWDTRPWSDEESDPALAEMPVPGANDGGSGVAALLELARLFAESPPPVGVDLAFFDAEDLGRPTRSLEYCLGSRYMVEHWTGTPPNYVLVLDMVGSPTVDFGRDTVSHGAFPAWNELVFGVARARGYLEFNPDRTYTVYDDHIPFLQAGVPSTVLIGFDDPNWHTQKDRPEFLSGERLRRVGEVCLEIVYGGYLGS